MSDYSSLQFEKIDDLPDKIFAPRQTKALGPTIIWETLPPLKELEIGQGFKFKIPEDNFGYNADTRHPVGSPSYYNSLKSAFSRTFQMIAKEKNIHFVYRQLEDEMYIKRVGA